MNRLVLSLSTPAICLALLAVPAVASAKKDPAKITCEEFAASTPEAQTRITAYLDGKSKSGKKVEDIGEVEVDRELDVLVVSCVQSPKVTFWDKVKAHLPGGKQKVKPVSMTCDEFLSLSSDVQPEVVYWLHGYNSKTSAAVNAAGEIDLETDTAVLVETCKPTPKASLWDTIRTKLEKL